MVPSIKLEAIDHRPFNQALRDAFNAGMEWPITHDDKRHHLQNRIKELEGKLEAAAADIAARAFEAGRITRDVIGKV